MLGSFAKVRLLELGLDVLEGISCGVNLDRRIDELARKDPDGRLSDRNQEILTTQAGGNRILIRLKKDDGEGRQHHRLILDPSDKGRNAANRVEKLPYHVTNVTRIEGLSTADDEGQAT